MAIRVTGAWGTATGRASAFFATCWKLYCFHARTHARTLRRLSRQSNAGLLRRVVGEGEEEEEEEDVPASAFLHVRDRQSKRDMTAAVMMSSEYHRSIPSSVDSSSSHSSSKMSSSSSSSTSSATTTQPDTAAVRTVMGVMGSWAMSILLNNELRQDIKSKCSERLQLETPGFKVQYAEQAVLANLDWGIEGLESAVKTTNQEARAARLEYSEKMLQVGDQFPHPFSQLAWWWVLRLLGLQHDDDDDDVPELSLTSEP